MIYIKYAVSEKLISIEVKKKDKIKNIFLFFKLLILYNFFIRSVMALIETAFEVSGFPREILVMPLTVTDLLLPSSFILALSYRSVTTSLSTSRSPSNCN